MMRRNSGIQLTFPPNTDAFLIVAGVRSAWDRGLGECRSVEPCTSNGQSAVPQTCTWHRPGWPSKQKARVWQPVLWAPVWLPLRGWPWCRGASGVIHPSIQPEPQWQQVCWACSSLEWNASSPFNTGSLTKPCNVTPACQLNLSIHGGLESLVVYSCVLVWVLGVEPVQRSCVLLCPCAH